MRRKLRKQTVVWALLEKLNDLVRDLNLSEENGELLHSRLKESTLWIVMCAWHTTERHEELKKFSAKTSDLVSRNNVEPLLLSLGVNAYVPDNWRLFIDISKRSFKCVLLHNGSLYSSIPVAHSTALKENYEGIKRL